ncbi:hypothetical protein BXT84_03020 [Sulfobacillus thermotolerans]|uniref:RsbT co-antagonist protein RsbRD N-terminal domain-containing protein n=1 Tax=Sulfobacillus thermotolerans TaxID=338644 RepID=A0ABM6RNX0_9FIRM|nr:hypothetical protein BXT84_03020 [Sulfobacillus thermotolerans]
MDVISDVTDLLLDEHLRLVDQWLAPLRKERMSDRSLLYRAGALADDFNHCRNNQVVMTVFLDWFSTS